MKFIPLLILVLSCGAVPLAATAQTPVLLRTFNNPTPEAEDFFGMDVAALGDDSVLIAAPGGAVAYRFSTDGTLQTTFTNPNPASLPGWYPAAIAGVGTSRVLIGSMDTNAHVFNADGVPVATLTNVDWSFDPYLDWFGSAVTALGADRAVIGAPGYTLEFFNAWNCGQAYLFGTNGTLLAVFGNPFPREYDQFGAAMTALGNDHVVIGSFSYYPGVAYLFRTNGAGQMTFTNPAPADEDLFGSSVAAVGADRVLIGAPGDDSAGTNAGVAYLFSTNGALLTTFTNPTPAPADNFGSRLDWLGNDRVIISAPGDGTGARNAGSAYVFNLTGTLLMTIHNPAPSPDDQFGLSMAALGGDRVLIAAPHGDAGATNAGSVYLFSVSSRSTPPSLTIQRSSTNTVVISWPTAATGFVLQQNTNGISTVNWSNVTAAPLNNGATKTVIVNPTEGNRFYRLVRP